MKGRGNRMEREVEMVFGKPGPWYMSSMAEAGTSAQKGSKVQTQPFNVSPIRLGASQTHGHVSSLSYTLNCLVRSVIPHSLIGIP